MNMKEKTLSKLNELNIKYEIIEHPPVYTIEDMENLNLPHIDCVAKNLFLRDDKGKEHFLICLEKNKSADLKALKDIIGSRRLSFASEERLKTYLDLTKGSVSPLGVLNNTDSSVKIIFDEDLMKKDFIGVHPNENTATVFLKFDDLKNIIENHGNQFQIINI